MEQLHFNSSDWAKSKAGVKWPDDLTPLRGYFLSSRLRPKTPAYPDKPFTNTDIEFERVVISLKDFIDAYLSRVLDTANQDEGTYRKLIFLLTHSFLGVGITTRMVENERKFSLRKIKNMSVQNPGGANESINVKAPPKNWDRCSPHEIWTKIIPSSISLAFLNRGVASITAAEQDNIFQILQAMIGPYLAHSKGRNQKFESARRAFERAYNDGSLDADMCTKAAKMGWFALQNELEKSVEYFLKSEYYAGVSSHLTNIDAATRYIKFWYTSKGPWSNGLQGATPALGESIPSVFSEMSSPLQDKFDEAVFIRNEVPELDVLRSILIFAGTHEQTVDKIRQAELNRKRKIRIGAHLPVKTKSMQFEVDDVSELGSADWRPQKKI